LIRNMPNIVDVLREEAISDCVAYTEFMLKYKKGEDVLHSFFEGYEDPTYYSIRINTLSSINKYNKYICGGKDDVLKVRNLIKSNTAYSIVKTGFFIDKDFDNQTYPSDVYVTPTYSIENFYCTYEAVQEILDSVFHIKTDSQDNAKCIGAYERLLNEFNNKTIFFNAWLACQADYRNENKLKTRLNIDKKAKHYFDNIVLSDLSATKDFDEFATKDSIEAIYVDAPKVDVDILLKKVDQLKTWNQVERFRGKFQIRFLTNFLTKLQSIVGRPDSTFTEKYSCSLRFEYATICTTLSQFAITPSCLKQYIYRISQA
jgi:hypothetical protein